MLLSISLILLAGLLFGEVFRKLRIPYIIGMLLTGILFGPFVLNLFDPAILSISGELREIALIIILAKAGLTLELDDLKRIGRPAVLMCFVPATFEIIGFLLFAPGLMGVSLVEAAILGAVMGAVSPAIVVPRMAMMIDEGWGTDRGIPQMIIAGSSADDVYVIVLFTALLSLASGGSVSALDFAQVPIAIVLGVLLGAALGMLLARFFQRFRLRDTLKVIILLAVSFLCVSAEKALAGVVGLSGLLAVMSLCVVLGSKAAPVAARLSGKFSKLWVAAEVFLFVLVGATVNIQYALAAGAGIILMLFIGLFFRLLGTWVSVLGTGMNHKEKLFCMLAQIPKATVQAAIGGVPLAMGLACGNTVLTFAVISIVISAPIGAWAIDTTYRRLLQKTPPDRI